MSILKMYADENAQEVKALQEKLENSYEGTLEHALIKLRISWLLLCNSFFKSLKAT